MKTKEQLEEELAALDRELNQKLADRETPDDSVTYGGYVTPVSHDHWSMRKEVPVSAMDNETIADWRGIALALCGIAK
jgi:hypothetical protein